MQEMWTPLLGAWGLFLHVVMWSEDAPYAARTANINNVWLRRMDPMKRPKPRPLADRIGDNMDYLSQLMATPASLHRLPIPQPDVQLPLFQQETAMLKTQGRKMPLTIERRRMIPGSRNCPSCRVDEDSENFWTLHYRYTDGTDGRDLLRCSDCTYRALEREYGKLEAESIAARKGLERGASERF